MKCIEDDADIEDVDVGGRFCNPLELQNQKNSFGILPSSTVIRK